MTLVVKRHIYGRPVGYAGKNGRAAPLEEQARKRAEKARRNGEKFFQLRGGALYVLCNGQYMDWSRADPKKIGQ